MVAQIHQSNQLRNNIAQPDKDFGPVALCSCPMQTLFRPDCARVLNLIRRMTSGRNLISPSNIFLSQSIIFFGLIAPDCALDRLLIDQCQRGGIYVSSFCLSIICFGALLKNKTFDIYTASQSRVSAHHSRLSQHLEGTSGAAGSARDSRVHRNASQKGTSGGGLSYHSAPYFEA